MESAVVLLSLCGVISVSGEFFHSPSITMIRPSGDKQNTDFGFSIAYQNSTHQLIVGAPREDFVGKVYSCPLKELNKDVACSVIDMTSLKLDINSNASRYALNEKQNFYFGSSLAATSDNFLTCAPLLTKTVSYKYWVRKTIVSEPEDVVCGACYLYNGTGYTEWHDNCVKLSNTATNTHTKLIPKSHRNTFIYKHNNQKDIFGGGFGWRTLVDPYNGYMLAVKSPAIGDILYVDSNNSLSPSHSMLEDYYNNNTDLFESMKAKFKNYYNLGLAVGNFFDRFGYYALSFLQFNLRGMILFIGKIESKLDFLRNQSIKNDFKPYHIEDKSLGSMFGSAMGAADITGDGLSELLVGAPAHADDTYQSELGALHIYIGGDVQSISQRKCTILGSKVNGRFGSAIATNDLDNDNIPEIFVGAPHEHSETGALYVISGYELNSLLGIGTKQIKLSDLTRTQKLHGDASDSKHRQWFGFSLQVVQDVDKNGCNELAVGVPAKSSVQLLRCLPAVIAYTSLELLGDQVVKVNAKLFTVSVCLNVTISAKCQSIVGSILVNSDVTGNTKIISPSFVYDYWTINELQPIKCNNITVHLLKEETADYTFSTEISIYDKINERKGKDYKPWAVLSHKSKEKNSIVVKRLCNDKECAPFLTYQKFWSGSDIIDASISQKETLSIMVNNTGHFTNSAYVQLTVHGIRISRLPERCITTATTNEYTCALPKPMSGSHSITVLLDTSQPTNTPILNITAQLYDTVFTNIKNEALTLTVPYQLNPQLVLVNGSQHNLNVTDKDLNSDDITIVNDNHEFNIYNKGPVLWKDITAILEIKNESFIQDVKIITYKNCQLVSRSKFKFICNLTISPEASIKIIANIQISKRSIENDVTEGHLDTSSELSLTLQPTNDTRLVKSTTRLNYEKILTVGNDKSLIIIIAVAVTSIVLLIFVFVLYKIGFFKRAQKQKLHVLRESVKRRNSVKVSESSKTRTSAGEDECDIEVVEEVLQVAEITPSAEDTKDDVVLIEEKAS